MSFPSRCLSLTQTTFKTNQQPVTTASQDSTILYSSSNNELVQISPLASHVIRIIYYNLTLWQTHIQSHFYRCLSIPDYSILGCAGTVKFSLEFLTKASHSTCCAIASLHSFGQRTVAKTEKEPDIEECPLTHGLTWYCNY